MWRIPTFDTSQKVLFCNLDSSTNLSLAACRIAAGH